MSDCIHCGTFVGSECDNCIADEIHLKMRNMAENTVIKTETQQRGDRKMNNVFNFIRMPDGQLHLKDFKPREDFEVHCRIRNGEDILKLYLINDLAKQNMIKVECLHIYWLAGARWDRPINNFNESFDLKVFSGLINGLNVPRVYIFDPHSDCALAAIDNSFRMDNKLSEFHRYWPENMLKKVVIPDVGATKSCMKFIKEDSLEHGSHIQFTKERDAKGSMSMNFHFVGMDAHSAHDQDFIVIDDICDGGATFIAIAEKLKPLKPKSLSLMVSHGIFSKGLKDLGSLYNNIYTTNSFKSSVGWAKRYDILTTEGYSKNEYFITD